MVTYTHSKNVNIGKAKAQRWTRESDVGHDPVWRTGDKWTDEALSHHHVIHRVLVLRHFVQKYSRSFLFYPFTCFFSFLTCMSLFYWRNRDRSYWNPARHSEALLPRNCYTTPAWALPHRVCAFRDARPIVQGLILSLMCRTAIYAKTRVDTNWMQPWSFQPGQGLLSTSSVTIAIWWATTS